MEAHGGGQVSVPRADTNGDGFPRQGGVPRLLPPEEDNNMKPHVLEQVWKALILTAMAASISKSSWLPGEGKDGVAPQEKDRFDSELDKNGDNLLSGRISPGSFLATRTSQTKR